MKRRAALALLAGGLTAGVGGVSVLTGWSPGGSPPSRDAITGGGDSPCPPGSCPGPTTRTGTPTETPTSSPSPTPPRDRAEACVDAEFDATVDVVDDLGCDPTGREPCAATIEAAATDGTLLRFPAGRYRIESSIELIDDARVGFAGVPEDDVRLVPAPGFNDEVLSAEVRSLVFEDIDVDLGAENTTAALRFICEEGFLFDSVEYLGRGTHTDDEVEFAAYLAVKRPEGCGLVRDVVARRGSAVGHYKNGSGRGGIWVGNAHRGTVVLDECRFEEFGNNGIYASRCPGDVRVRGCLFKNNSPSSVRISGEGSVVEDTTVLVDLDDYGGPMTSRESINTRGIVVEQGGIEKVPGAVIRNCSVRVETSTKPVPGIQVWTTGHTVTILDTDIRMINPGPGVHRTPRERRGEHPPADAPRWVRMENVTVTGRSTDFAPVQLADAPGSVIRNCHVRQRGRGDDSVRLIRSYGTLIDGGTIEGSRHPIVATVEPGTDACLLRMGATPTLRGARSGPGGSDREFSLPAATADWTPDDGPTCVGSVGRFEGGADAETSLAITDVDERNVNGVLLGPDGG